MKNLALYRKYRPKFFKEVIGQEHIVRTLTNAVSLDDISHAYLFAGPKGSGKTTISRLLAKSANCQNRKKGEYEPCNECSSCSEINRGNAMDLIEIDAGTNTGVDDIRDLKEGIGFLPVKSKYKVFIIDECHQLSKSANNALLKTLEEPPSHAIFIFATTEPQKMIATVISRCQRFDFRRLKPEEIVGKLERVLEKEKVKFEPEALNLIAFSSGGSMRDAETLLDQIISFSGEDRVVKKDLVEQLTGLANKKTIFQFLEYLAKKKVKETIEFLNNLIIQGVDLEEFSRTLVYYFREVLVLRIAPEFKDQFSLTLSAEERKYLIDLFGKFSEIEVREILEKLSLANQKTKYAAIPQLPLELAVIEICGEEVLK